MYHNHFTAEMQVGAPPERVFPLLCPVREREWVDGWQAELLFSRSGLAEAGCVFRTAVSDGSECTWVVHACQPSERIGFTLLVPGQFVELLEIGLAPGPGGTLLRWSRQTTALHGDAAPRVAERAATLASRHRWLAQALDHYLRTGACLRHEVPA